jgi:GT2 family glycosyltransferase
MELSIIIINYNTWQYVLQAVQSIVTHTHGLRYEIIVVDNASQDADPASLQAFDAPIHFIAHTHNAGFAGGNNVGIKQAKGQYILLFNSDAYLTENAFLPMVQYMQAHPTVGVLSPRLVYPDGRVQSAAQRFPSVKYTLYELLRLQKLFGKQWAAKTYLGAFFDGRTTLEADWVWGTAMLMPRKVINQLPKQQLNEQFFMYWEDVQWCWEIKQLGYKVVFLGSTEVVHIGGGSSGKKNEMMAKNEQLLLQQIFTPNELNWYRRLQKLLQA